MITPMLCSKSVKYCIIPTNNINYNVCPYIKLQMEIMGQSVFEFSHPCDHDEIREALRSTSSARRDLLLRLKCTLTSKGRNVHLKSASYKVWSSSSYFFCFFFNFYFLLIGSCLPTCLYVSFFFSSTSYMKILIS